MIQAKVDELLQWIIDSRERGFDVSATSAVQEWKEGDLEDEEIISYLSNLKDEIKELLEVAYKNRWQDEGFLTDVAYHGPYG